MRTTPAFSVGAFARLVSFGVSTYGTVYLALPALGVVTGALFTSTWSLEA